MPKVHIVCKKLKQEAIRKPRITKIAQRKQMAPKKMLRKKCEKCGKEYTYTGSHKKTCGKSKSTRYFVEFLLFVPSSQ
jgi:uncharacterized OB-fold protein